MATATFGRRRALALLLLVAAIGIGALPLVLFGDHEWVRWWVAVVWPLAPLTAGAGCFYVSRRLSGHESKAWACFGLGNTLYGAADINWSIYNVWLDIPAPIVSAGNFAYYSFPLLYIIGIWYYRAPARSRGATLVQVGNLGITFASVLLAYVILFHELLRTTVDSSEATSILLFGILGISAAFFALINVSFYLWGRQRLVMFVILLGLATAAATDINLTYEVLQDEYASINLINVLYLVAFGMLFWSAFERALLQDAAITEAVDSAVQERGRRWETLLPPVAVAGVLAIVIAFREELNLAILPFAVGALALFVISLAAKNWWGYQVESELRMQTQASEAELLRVNRELRDSIGARSLIEEELRQAQRMDALGQLTGGVAHDFNNLLAVVLGNLELAEQKVRGKSDVQELLSDAATAVERGSALTHSLLSFSRAQELKPQVIDVGSLLLELEILLDRSFGEMVEVHIETPEGSWNCLADRAQLENAVLNLAINARDAMPGGGEIAIAVANVTLDEAYVAEHPDAQTGSFVSISVRDTGVGISQEVLPKVFEPFFTTKEVGRGTGLGLSMVYGFAKQSRGHVAIQSEEGRGTEVQLYLPKSTTPVQSAESEDLADAPRGNGEYVLVVEDEAPLRKLTQRLLNELGYVAFSAADGIEALAALNTAERLDLLLSDVVLPGALSGIDLVKEATQRRPDLKFLLMSGYAPDAGASDAQRWIDAEPLNKPFRIGELARAVRSVLDESDTSPSAS